MNLDEYLASQQREFNENSRNRQTNNAILTLANKQLEANCIQRETNAILEKQANELTKRNSYLEAELSNAKKEAKFSRILTIISASVAFASLVATILIAFLK